MYDIGVDAELEFRKINKYVKKYSKCSTLWASCRMPYDIKTAKKCGADIITMAIMISKLKNFNIKSENIQKRQLLIYNDTQKSKFKF